MKWAKPTMRNADDPRLLWHAFCGIHKKNWKDQKTQKVSENKWNLRIYSYDQTISNINGAETIVKQTHLRKVTTDPRKAHIIGWKSIVETSNKGFERTR